MMLANLRLAFDYIGLSDLSTFDKWLLTRRIYEELEMTVGHRLAIGLTRHQLFEFQEIIEYLKNHQTSPEDDPSLQWLEQTRPQYRDVVLVCLELQLQQLCDNVDRIARIAEISVKGGNRNSRAVLEYLREKSLETAENR